MLHFIWKCSLMLHIFAITIASINIVQMKALTNNAVEQIKGNQRLIGRLMALFNKSSFTIARWIEDKDVRLTTPNAIQIINDETGLRINQILEDIPAVA
jgi:hypothetical protein